MKITKIYYMLFLISLSTHPLNFKRTAEFLPGLRRQKSLTVRSQYINKKELRLGIARLRKHSLFLLFLTSLSYLNSAVYFSIRVCVGTWNVGGKLPPNDFDIDDWLDINHPADIYVLG